MFPKNLDRLCYSLAVLLERGKFGKHEFILDYSSQNHVMKDFTCVNKGSAK